MSASVKMFGEPTTDLNDETLVIDAAPLAKTAAELREDAALVEFVNLGTITHLVLGPLKRHGFEVYLVVNPLTDKVVGQFFSREMAESKAMMLRNQPMTDSASVWSAYDEETKRDNQETG